MKTAKLQNGEWVEAGEGAPEEANCPICNGEMTLRSRRRMNNGGRAYFWRHKPNGNLKCRGRSRFSD